MVVEGFFFEGNGSFQVSRCCKGRRCARQKVVPFRDLLWHKERAYIFKCWKVFNGSLATHKQQIGQILSVFIRIDSHSPLTAN